MSVNTAAGSRFFIGTTLAIDETSDATAKAAFATDTYEEVGEVEDLGEFGDEAGEAQFTSLADRRVRKFKTTFDAGMIPVVCGDDPSDAGQQAMVAAFASDLDYNFKILLNDQLTISGTPTVQYCRGKVMSKRRVVGTVTNVTRRRFSVGVNSEIYEIAAT
jgi:hypothetical protein